MKNLLKKIKYGLWIIIIVAFLTIGSFSGGRYWEYVKWNPLVDYWKNQVPVLETKESIPDTIKRVCDEEDVEWIKCIRIADYESRLDKYFKERMKDGSYDRGVFAINSKHCSEINDDCAFEVECATRYFTKEVKAGKISKWLGAQVLGYK